MEPEVIAALITAIAALVILGPTYLLNRKLERYKTELGEDAQDLRAQIEHQQALSKLRLAEYPKLAKNVSELISGIRLAASGTADAVDTAALRFRVEQLEDSLYSTQLQLEQDELHADVHGFKNGTLTVLQLVAEREKMARIGDVHGAEEIAERLRAAVGDLEEVYPQIRERLASRLGSFPVPAPDPGDRNGRR